MRLLADLGVTDVGENRHQEAAAKAAECADLGLRWHFVGGLQSNKAAAVGGVRRRRRVGRPGQAAGRARSAAPTSAARPVDVLLQVSLDPPGAARAGPARDPADLLALAAAVRRADGALRLRGLMAVAPLGEDPDAAFARLAGDPRRPASTSTPTPPGSRPA